MGLGRAYVAALAELAGIGDPEERRRTWRQGMAALAQAVADRRDAPLEGLDPLKLLAALRVALADGLLADMEFLGAASATATFALAGGLPPGPERRELGRRVLEQLDAGDAETFVALATSLVLASRRPLVGWVKRARVAAALSAPLAAGTGGDALALALLTGPELERSWLAEPSQGSLPSRRLAARVLERAAREAVSRQRRGDDGGIAILSRRSVREVWARLIGDRESLVWRHVAIARGLLAGAEHALADEIERDLAPTGTPSQWRRGAASLAARIELDAASAARCLAFLDGDRVAPDAGVVRALIAGLAGAFAVEPDVADDLATRAIARVGLDAVEALVDLRHDLGPVAPRATEAAAAWLTGARAADRGDGDEEYLALLASLAGELGGGADAVGGSLAAHAAAARIALRGGRLAEAVRAAGLAVEAAAEAVEFLERADDADPIDRRHVLRTLRELDRELLSDGTVVSLLARNDDVRRGTSGAARIAALQEHLERALLVRERSVETGPIAHRMLRFARLRALVRAVDADAADDDPGALRDRRLEVVRALLPRARLEASPLRRSVWAALTRTFDALLRDELLELSDLIAGVTTAMEPDEDFAVAREASMLPGVRDALEAYAAAMSAASGGADPADRAAAIAAVSCAAPLTRALAAVSSPRTDVLRANLGQLGRALETIVRARGQRDVPAAALEQLGASAAALADLAIGARRRLGLPVSAPTSPVALHALVVAVERLRRGAVDDVSEEAATAANAAGDDQIPLVGRLIGVAMARLAQLPIDSSPADITGVFAAVTIDDVDEVLPEPVDASLPGWLPASRTLGGFYVLRPLGKGAGGSVFVACRVEERHEAGAEAVALKVPDYDGGAARNLSSDEFTALFREEAGALLAVPHHANIARFVTFDAGARPKPILVMEYVPGQTLEQLLDVGGLTLRDALGLVDGIAGGLEAMHGARVAHLDLKPANVILRGDSVPVLVDFGLSGRRLRPGCGSPHYGAPEVWNTRVASGEPWAADTYGLACLAYEILTGEVLVHGESLPDVLTVHRTGGAEKRVRAALGRDRRTAPLGQLLGAALHPRAEQRPTLARLRAGFAAVAPDLATLGWPLPISA